VYEKIKQNKEKVKGYKIKLEGVESIRVRNDTAITKMMLASAG